MMKKEERSDQMEIKWYWLAETLGYVKDISHLGNNLTYEVSSKVGEFFLMLYLMLFPVLFVFGFLLRFFSFHRKGERTAALTVRCGVLVLLVYAVMLAVRIGPYVEFYPQGSGFIDLSTLNHILDGIGCALLALTLFLGGRLGNMLAKRLRK